LATELRIVPLEGIPEVAEGDDIGELVSRAVELQDDDIVVLAQKIVSKAEGRVVRLDDIEPSSRAVELAGDLDARRVEAILRESQEIVRVRPPLIIAETRHGFICASAGVDSSNAPEQGMLVLLPEDPDASAARIRDRIRELTGRMVGVLVTDSFGRPWRQGTTDVAIGAAGLPVVLDLRGRRDRVGYELHATMIAVAELVMGKVDGIPGAVVRGLQLRGDGNARDLAMPAERDLFR
jgi:coenzyme F420-0:L-glutamate ligase/coenzyme F420-1:gamma-L-glutamate ligase